MKLQLKKRLRFALSIVVLPILMVGCGRGDSVNVIEDADEEAIQEYRRLVEAESEALADEEEAESDRQ